MHIRHLSLADFRNYRELELDLPPGPLLFIGDNAQGKTNLLEAVYLLSTIRSLRAGSDSELIRWEVAQESLPIARLVAEAERSSGPVRVEMVVQGQPVTARQGVVVVEAMKMENELRAPYAGVVKAVHVGAGASVDAGQVLVELDS
jgi:recombinational DNA repair ATPase RecF